MIYFELYPKIPIIPQGKFFFRVSKNVSESYFLGACIINRMDLDGGVKRFSGNCLHSSIVN